MNQWDFKSPQYGSFDTRTFEVLTCAFDDAWRSLESGGVRLYDDADADLIRETLAKRIVDAARAGELDWRRLRASALHHIAVNELC